MNWRDRISRFLILSYAWYNKSSYISGLYFGMHQSYTFVFKLYLKKEVVQFWTTLQCERCFTNVLSHLVFLCNRIVYLLWNYGLFSLLSFHLSTELVHFFAYTCLSVLLYFLSSCKQCDMIKYTLTPLTFNIFSDIYFIVSGWRMVNFRIVILIMVIKFLQYYINYSEIVYSVI